MAPRPWLDSPAHARWLERAADDLLEFGRAAVSEQGFGWLGDDGVRTDDGESHLWLTSRMTYVQTLGHLMGRPGSRDLAEHGLRALLEGFADPEHGGWFACVSPRGAIEDRKEAYQHSFVLLAGASATIAGLDGGRELLDEAVGVIDRHFWDSGSGTVRESWDRAFSQEEPYRGANANMHSVEAFLAAADATGDERWLRRALSVTERVVHHNARAQGWRMPEHFTLDWEPVLDYNVEIPAHAFRPYGATIGHWMEWSRLAVTLRGALLERGLGAPEWLMECAIALFETAVAAWAADGRSGFVYTVGWEGEPVVTERMHWVVTEAIGAAAALYRVTGRASYDHWYARFWDHARSTFITAPGSWRHEVDAQGRPSTRVWTGRPDVYHSIQATLVPRVRPVSGLARALTAGDLG